MVSIGIEQQSRTWPAAQQAHRSSQTACQCLTPAARLHSRCSSTPSTSAGTPAHAAPASAMSCTAAASGPALPAAVGKPRGRSCRLAASASASATGSPGTPHSATSSSAPALRSTKDWCSSAEQPQPKSRATGTAGSRCCLRAAAPGAAAIACISCSALWRAPAAEQGGTLVAEVVGWCRLRGSSRHAISLPLVVYLVSPLVAARVAAHSSLMYKTCLHCQCPGWSLGSMHASVHHWQSLAHPHSAIAGRPRLSGAMWLAPHLACWSSLQAAPLLP